MLFTDCRFALIKQITTPSFIDTNMLKILNLGFLKGDRTVFCEYLGKRRSCFNFSTVVSDPYYILGVEKAEEFKLIKQAFFKIANEFHPDKNNSMEAKNKFLRAKQAFEAIKMEKGLMKPQNFVESNSYESVRPNTDQFMSEDEEGQRSDRDYRIFRQKAGTKTQYEQFNSSFNTIHEINSIKIKVQEGEMKDSFRRFGLNEVSMKIKLMSESSNMFVLIGGFALVMIFTAIAKSESKIEKEEMTGKVTSQIFKSRNQEIVSEEQQTKRRNERENARIKAEEIMKTLRKNNMLNKDEEKVKMAEREKLAMINNQKKEKVHYVNEQDHI